MIGPYAFKTNSKFLYCTSTSVKLSMLSLIINYLLGYSHTVGLLLVAYCLGYAISIVGEHTALRLVLCYLTYQMSSVESFRVAPSDP